MAERIERPFGLSVHSEHLNDAYFAACAEAGVYSVELSCNEDHFYRNMDWEKICGMILSHGLKINSLHLQFGGQVNIAHPDPACQADTLERHMAAMTEAAKYGVKIIVLHPSAEPIADEDRAAAMETSKKNLRILADHATTLGQTIAVEDLPRTCLGRNSAEMLELLSADERLRACFDTNHLLAEPIADCVRAIGDKIITLHVSDYDFIDERHMIPGELDIDWVEFLDLLDEIGYKGVFNYEVTGAAKNRYIQREADVSPADYRRNYDSLVRRETPIIPKGTVTYR